MSSVQRQWGQQLGKEEQLCSQQLMRAKQGRLVFARSTYYVILFARNFRKENVASDERMGTGVAQM